MARTGYNRGTSSDNHYRRTKTDNRNGKSYTYVDGTAVRKLNVTAPAEETQHPGEVSSVTRKNRERALQMNLRYVLFLTAAAVISVIVCVNYLQLRAVNTLLQEDVASLTAELDSAILENDSEYNRVMNSVDLEHVRDVAMNELGMQQATSDQVVTYETEGSDYVRQYSDIPAE
ncbi:MAG: hypothetical protein LUH07_04705 [Lachnospiraceae bacterium]|nr:hypothetical protein [Lachnospiraceae bacterium]